MPVQQGSLDLLQHPTAQQLLRSTIPARLAYIGTDGSPRVVPIWFHWNEREFVLGTPAKAPKLKALAKNPKVALTIDSNTFPHDVLLVRGSARLEPTNQIVPEYALAAERYFGPRREKPGSRNSRRWLPTWSASRSSPNGSACSTSRHASPAPSRSEMQAATGGFLSALSG